MFHRRRTSKNYEFDDRQINNNSSVFSAYREESEDCAKIKQFQVEESFTDKKPSIITLMEEVKLIFTEKG